MFLEITPRTALVGPQIPELDISGEEGKGNLMQWVGMDVRVQSVSNTSKRRTC